MHRFIRAKDLLEKKKRGGELPMGQKTKRKEKKNGERKKKEPYRNTLSIPTNMPTETSVILHGR